jgi:ParB-like chromosome segregation protein Spo0J
MSESYTILKAAESKSTLFDIPLESIGTYNVREVLPRLAEAGHTYEALIKMAVGTPESKAEFVRLIEEHEAESARLEPREQTIVSLAESILDHGQQQPIKVRQTGLVARRDTDGKPIEGEKRYGYMVIMGNRRTIAIAYLFALGIITEPTVLGIQEKMTKEEALDASFAENVQRRDMTLRQIGEYVAIKLDQGKSWGEIVRKVGRTEEYAKDALALVRPLDESAPLDLPEQVQRGEITKGKAVQIAKGKTKLGDGGERLFRTVRKTISVKAIEDKIDTTGRDDAGVIRITALAEALGSTYEVELKASDDRIAKALAKAEADAAKEVEKARKAESDALKKQAAELIEKAKAVAAGTVTTTTVTIIEETMEEAA